MKMVISMTDKSEELRGTHLLLSMKRGSIQNTKKCEHVRSTHQLLITEG